jgi:hypothetical protein
LCVCVCVCVGVFMCVCVFMWVCDRLNSLLQCLCLFLISYFRNNHRLKIDRSRIVTEEQNDI